MEITFNDSELADLYEGKKVKNKKFNSNPTLVGQYIKTIAKLKGLIKFVHISQIQSLQYEKLKGDRKGFSSVRINKQYRLLFREIVSETEPFEVEIIHIEEISKHYE